MGFLSLEVPLRTAYPYVQTILLLDALDLADEMSTMTEESVEEHTINRMDVMVDHLMN